MGLAASQARLLTITARLADNELRSQTINNAKMRLATMSAQASDEYVSALNDAQMMFSNTTPDGLTQSQALSFNALTQYSPYNTQYGIINSAGQILVSEEDAKIFESCHNDLDAFLKAHNLEWETTFFDEANGNLAQKVTTFYGTDEKDIGYLFYNYTDKGDGTYAAELKINKELKQMYLDSLSQESSIEKLNYSIIAKKFRSEVANIYKSTVGEYVQSIFGNDPTTQIKNIKDDLSNKDLNDIKEALLNNQEPGYGLNNIKKYLVDSGYNELLKKINSLNTFQVGENTTTVGFAKATSDNAIDLSQSTIPLEYGVTITKSGSSYKITNPGTEAEMLYDGIKKSSVTGTNIQEMLRNIVLIPNERKKTITQTDANQNEYTTEITQQYYGYYVDTDTNKAYPVTLKTGQNKETNEVYFETRENIIKAFLNDYFNSIQLQGTFDPFKYLSNSGNNSAALNSYNEAKKEYEKYEIILDMPDELVYLSDFDKFISEYDHDKIISNQSEYFKSVLNSYAADKMLDVLGEPKYTWVDGDDTTNSGNAESKAKWLTNLFNRMQKGYKALENGLAKSTQWLEYAFESGLVTMEQVDLSQNWNALDYKSCANIFEQTDNSAAVAKAEAKYNRAMNDIKQKDSMFDLQLKNIDTEHNALQTEFDVIKGVISKNIERTMKFNQSA